MFSLVALLLLFHEPSSSFAVNYDSNLIIQDKREEKNVAA